jgi:hypothetical protein
MASHSHGPIDPETIIKTPLKPLKPLSRRTALKLGGLGLVGAAGLGALAWAPRRVVRAATPPNLPEIQFDVGAFTGPGQTINGLQVNFHPVFTLFLTAKLTRTPTRVDLQTMNDAMARIESVYPFSPSGVFAFIAYGLPYFRRLPQSLVNEFMPRLASDTSRFVLEEAVPSPTDIPPGTTNFAALPKVQQKRIFKVPVTIEQNDLLWTIRSDQLANVFDVVNWLEGSNSLDGFALPSPNWNGLVVFTSVRYNFVQPGMPRKVADNANLPYAFEINPQSSMWMGFVDQQAHGSAPDAQTVTFAGSSHAHLTTATSSDYFGAGAIQHLSRDIDDLAQFYSKTGAESVEPETFSERIQYMHRSKTPNQQPGLPFPQDPNDPFTNGGGLNAINDPTPSAFIENFNFGPNDQATNFDPDALAQNPPVKQYRVSHTAGLQRSSRAADGTPLHIRNDGPGFSSLDVPDGSTQPTLEFTVFVQTAEFFRVMRINSASLDFVNTAEGGTAASVPPGTVPSAFSDGGLERFLTATRRQNFLIPPRSRRAFPLVEFT